MLYSKKTRIVGWIISGLVGGMLLGPSAIGKFTEWEGKAQMFDHLGLTTDLAFKLGFLEVTLAVLYLVPRTSFLGAILLTGYLGGATLTHIRVGDPFFTPIILGVILWIGLTCRRPEIWSLVINKDRR